jgi:hypothetical protein
VASHSGVAVGDGINYGPAAFIFGNTAVASMAQLDPVTSAFVQVQQLAGGLPSVTINMSTTVAGAVITTPITIKAGTDSASATLTGSGSGTVSADVPAGFTDPGVYRTANIFF